jgi:hypothetical protein
MNEKPNHAVAGDRPSRWAGLMLWLAAHPRGRWATARGRWCQTVLTACLVVTGISAWALALVQPWTGRSADYGIVTFGDGMDTGKIRGAPLDVEKLFPTHVPAPKPLVRNPFATPGAPRAAVGPETALPENQRPDKAAAAVAAPAPLAKTILEKIKGLRLEVTLTAPTGERWAVINGENLREGDTVAGLEITEIQEGKVKLQHGGTTCLLRMD